MTALRGPTAGPEDTPSPITCTAASLIHRVGTQPELLQHLSERATEQVRLAELWDPVTLWAGSDKTLQPQHRVQVSIRGQRFEMAIDAALNYFTALYLFFAVPVDTTCQRIHQGETGTAVIASSVGSGGVLVQDLCATTASAEGLSKLFLAHYRHTVTPLLTELLHAIAKTVSTSTDLQQLAPALPPLVAPVEVVWDASRSHWQFVFQKRLPDDVAAAEKLRIDARHNAKLLHQQRQHQQEGNGALCAGSAEAAIAPPPPSSSSTTSRTGQIYALEPNENPFLLLQPHFMGIVVVLARRASKLLGEHMARTAGTGASVADAGNTQSPAFPARWHELDYDAQLSLAQLVRSLGVSLLLESFSVPTADRATSDYADDDSLAQQHPQGASAREETATGQQGHERFQDVAEGLPDKALHLGETASDREVVSTAWVRQGCAACGMSGHPTDACPFLTKT